VETQRSKSRRIQSLLLDGYRPSEIARIVPCRREYVSRIGARMRKPPSTYSWLVATVETLRHQHEELRVQVERLAQLHVQASKKT
jgi:hypothetical protein